MGKGAKKIHMALLIRPTAENISSISHRLPYSLYSCACFSVCSPSSGPPPTPSPYMLRSLFNDHPVLPYVSTSCSCFDEPSISRFLFLLFQTCVRNIKLVPRIAPFLVSSLTSAYVLNMKTLEV